MPIEAASKQLEIEQTKERARAEYPRLWRRMIQEWKASEQEEAAWLTYAANYLFSTDGVKWAIDPYSLYTRLKDGNQPDFIHDLDALQLVVLTHAHNDHLDVNLISAIQHLPITWVIPEFVLGKIKESVTLPDDRILVPQVGCPIRFGNLTLHPFEGLHLNHGRGVPEMGYLAEFNQKRWLFPGDTRRYEVDRIPHFQNLTGVFAHLWMGKGCALEDTPPLLDDFCKFFSALEPHRIIVTHLQEMGRVAEEYWDLNHYELVRQKMSQAATAILLDSALMGQKVVL